MASLNKLTSIVEYRGEVVCGAHDQIHGHAKQLEIDLDVIFEGAPLQERPKVVEAQEISTSVLVGEVTVDEG